jgi:hypothetical protein
MKRLLVSVFLLAAAASAAETIYLRILARHGFDWSRLAPYGDILSTDGRSAVLATTEDAIDDLNRLPVELAPYRATPPAEPLLSGKPALPTVDSGLVQDLVNRVSPDSILGTIRRLQDFYTRYSRTESCRSAVTWIRTKFQEYGCDSTALDTFRSTYAPNCIGIKRGTVNPRQVYVICGHADNTSEQQPSHCPGSDDNASGTTAVIEACRVFADVRFENTVYFIAFTGEEQGLFGSDSFATRARRRGDSIVGVLNFDMISYGRQNRDSFDVTGKESDPDCQWLVDFYIAQADTFTTLKTVRVMDPGALWSDHASFWNQGYVAFCGIERDFTPCYHTIGDTIGPLYYIDCGTNNCPMATEAIKAAVASVAKLAGASAMTPVEEEERLARTRELSVLPTIGTGRFTVRLPAQASRLDVYNAAGSRVLVVPVNRILSTISLSLRPGVYIVRSGSQSVPIRIIR